MANNKRTLFLKRRLRVRNKLRKVNSGKMRLSVHRSNKNISVQLIDDANGVPNTLVDVTGGVGFAAVASAFAAGVKDPVVISRPFSPRPDIAPRKSRTAEALTAPLYLLHWKYTGKLTRERR